MAAALRAVERASDFAEFEIFRLRVLEGQSGRKVAQSLGTSEATISRRLASVRTRLREHLTEVFSKYSFTQEEWEELERNGLDPSPNKRDDAAFDEAIAEVFHRLHQRGAGDDAAGESPSMNASL